MTAVRFSPSEGAPNSLVSKPADNSVRQVCHLLSSASIYESRGAALQQLGGYMRGVSGGCFGLDQEKNFSIFGIISTRCSAPFPFHFAARS